MKNNNIEKSNLSGSKKKIFWIITVSIPFILFILLEVILRIFNYGGDLSLFVDGPKGYDEYLRPNFNVGRRYFYQENSVPTPPLQLIRRVKSKNAFRTFVLGGSSTAGFPYGNNASFPNYLQRALQKVYPDKEIEIVNVAMSAVNSYTLRDIIDEVIEQDPDLLLVYAGHNEYYGALGVGSVQSLGNSIWLINSYLKLQSLKVFILLRDFIGWVKFSAASIFNDDKNVDPSGSLMARIVGEQTIPYKSELYNLGILQFKTNISAILEKAKINKIPVIISDLVSNLKDQKPFISIDGKYSAIKEFNSALKAKNDSNYVKANNHYLNAKDYDVLRFRAPEEMNETIYSLGKQFNFPVVYTKQYFENNSADGLIGNSLLLEHLHPNKEGYHLIARAFFDKIIEDQLIGKPRSTEFLVDVNDGLTQLDSVYAAMVIKDLKSGWPFKKDKSAGKNFVTSYKPKNNFEKISLHIFKTKDYNIESGHMELGKRYEQNNQLDLAYAEFNALLTSIPHEIEFYEKAATVLLKQKKYSKADSFLRKSLTIKPNYFALKWIGQIAVRNKDYETAIKYLANADLGDSQVVFNLSRAYYQSGEWGFGEEYFKKLTQMSGEKQYIAHLKKLRIITKTKSTK